MDLRSRGAGFAAYMGQTLFFHETCRSSCWVLFTKAGLVRSYATLKVLSWTFTWQG